MNAEPDQMPLDPPTGLVAANPQNLTVGKYYFVNLATVQNGAVVPDDSKWWDFVKIYQLTPESVKYERKKILMAGAGGVNMWYEPDPVDDPDEELDLTQPRDAVVESTQGLADGQYFVFYTKQQQQQAGRRRRMTRRLRKRRRSTRRRYVSK